MNSFLRNKFLGVLTGVLLIQAALFYFAARGERVPSTAPLLGFPRTLRTWVAVEDGVIPQDELDVLKADDTMIRVYARPTGEASSLFIAFFKTQRAGQSPHSPKNCLPGSGWQPSESGRVDVPIPGGDPIRVNRYLVTKGDSESLVLYWYQSQGRVIADEFAARFYLIEDSIRKHRSDTALVRVVVPVVPGHREVADAVGRDFVQAAYPTVALYLPH